MTFYTVFFSSIAYNLEDNNWGTKFPFIMKELYAKELQVEHIPEALKEINLIRELFKEYAPNCVIWDIENLEKRPPWGDNIAAHITSLSNYFYTSDGEDLFETFLKALETAARVNKVITIKSL
ncbi:Imm70 family immunity protein [Pedobacter lusitanus]|uniref:Imm70 family immunity protein n=1 Tax=Pedobacter lusitanus TaxID=1503925 RepID=UPI00190F5FBF|nr:Imm70 family immunity protein [Pedobacter lusitanus]